MEFWGEKQREKESIEKESNREREREREKSDLIESQSLEQPKVRYPNPLYK